MANVYYLTKVTTWKNAQAAAQSMGGNLVTVNDAAENQFLVDAFGGSERLWIGFNDIAQEGVWEWVSGETPTYTNWGAGQPDNGGNVEDYVGTNFGGPGLWNDFPNTGYNQRGIVEVPNTLPALSIGDFEVVEINPWLGSPVAKFIVKLSAVTNEPVSLEYATQDGTAIAGEDYTATTGTLTFEPGEKVKTITVPIVQDVITESTPETFDLVLSNPTNATLDDAVGTGTIVDGGTHYIYKLTNSATWTNAQAAAQSMGGNLVTVNDAAENQFLVDAFGGSELLWIGFNDAEEEGVWEWVSGEPVTYTNWKAGQPDNWNNEDYAHIYENGQWNDLPNTGWQGYIRGIVEIVKNPATNGNDTITGSNDAEAIEGLAGDDKITAKGGNDYLSAGEGNDNLDGGTGADAMKGGSGDDAYTVDNSGDKVTEGVDEGTDVIKSAVTRTLPVNVENLILTGKDKINGTGNVLDNILTGNSGNNKLSGKEGNDTLNGKAGTDTLAGGAGNDKYTVDSTDTVTELPSEGTDVILADSDYTLPENVENLTLKGTAANGTGNVLNNNIIGNASNNLLFGNGGNDKLTGGAGNDLLLGSTGDDWFIFKSPTEGVDTIIDFASGDKIRCDDLGFGGGLVPGVLLESQFVVGAGALDADDRFVYNAGSLFYDVDGSGSTAQVQLASLTGAPLLTASDIVIF